VNPTFCGTDPYGKPQEEASPQDEQAQAPQALEVEPPQEAHMAEVGFPAANLGGLSGPMGINT
jgi:hypothetical protein